MSLMANIDERLLFNKSLIIYQKQEIQKAESSLLELRKCLISQHNALNIFLTEGDELQKEISKRIKISLIEHKLECENVIENEEIENVTSNKKLKEEKKVLKKSNKVMDMKTLCKLEIPGLENITVNTIFTKSDYADIYIGGSNGLLLKYNDSGTHLFVTNTTDDICEIEFMKEKGKIYLLAFTSDKILIYPETFFTPTHVKEFIGIKNIINDGNMIFIILVDGSVKKLCKINWEITNDVRCRGRRLLCYFPKTLNGELALLVPEKNNLLYKSNKTFLGRSVLIEGMKGVKMIMRVNHNKFLCYSKLTAWFLSSTGEIVTSITFQAGIKYVARDSVSLAVVDKNNTVYVYVLEEKNYGVKIYEKTLIGNITAIAINHTKSQIYIAIGHSLFSFVYTVETR